uniref:BZIP domain-containing protein n=1 Tax=Bionectria ochroleuca TaxID=29856 RepID=A0A8H7NI95_BIOOC
MAAYATDLPMLPVHQNATGNFDDDSFISKCDQAQKVDESSYKYMRVSLTQTQTHDAAKTSRLTENKRRYRARRKEYILDLERRIAESREQEIKATMEVQFAARKVVVENGWLKELLRQAGFTDEDIHIWVKREHCGGDADGADCTRRQGSDYGGGKASSSGKNSRMREMGQAGEIPESTNPPSIIEDPLVNEPNSHHPDSDRAMAPSVVLATTEAPGAGPVETHTCHDKQITPCKILSRLAENPAADVTQIPIPPSSNDPPKDAAYHGGDVECGKAYEMLMRYATSEEKMDHIARALEGGCSSTGNGGCAVKKNVVWETLDNLSG